MIEGEPETFSHNVGDLQVRLAASESELREAQALRYRVFLGDRFAGYPSIHATQLDADAYDPFCDHLLVIDRSRNRVVGTYRLLRQIIADQNRGFYSRGEFDISPLLAQARKDPTRQLLEIGRSCVDPDYRGQATIAMLWRGIATYLRIHRVSFLFGCASFPGTDPDAHAMALTYLYRHHLAPPELRVRTLAMHHVEMNRIAPDLLAADAAFRELPPLIRGYLRVGAMIGDGAFVDRDFGSVDVFVLMPTAQISKRYAARFSETRTPA